MVKVEEDVEEVKCCLETLVNHRDFWRPLACKTLHYWWSSIINSR